MDSSALMQKGSLKSTTWFITTDLGGWHRAVTKPIPLHGISAAPVEIRKMTEILERLQASSGKRSEALSTGYPFNLIRQTRENRNGIVVQPTILLDRLSDEALDAL